MSLVFYHRGHKLRPELQEFRLGIQKAQEAIDNSVGCRCYLRFNVYEETRFRTLSSNHDFCPKFICIHVLCTCSVVVQM